MKLKSLSLLTIATIGSLSICHPSYANKLNRVDRVFASSAQILSPVKQIALTDSFSNLDKAESYYRGALLKWYSDWQGAISEYDIAIRLNPQYADAYYSRGIVKNQLGDKQSAINDWNKAAELYRQQGAMSSYQEVIARISKTTPSTQTQPSPQNTQDAIAYAKHAEEAESYCRGAFLKWYSDWQGAISSYNTAIRLNPQSAKAYDSRGIVKNQLGDKQSAINDWNKAAELYREQGAMSSYQEVIARINQATPSTQTQPSPQNTQDAVAYYNLGVNKDKSGDKKGAIADYDIAIRINPQYADAYNNRGNIKSELGDKKGAISDYDIAIQINPQSAGYYTNRGAAKSAFGDKKGAIADYDIAIRINPQSANTYNNRGIAKADLGDKKGAIVDYDIAIRINPQSTEAYNNRGIAKADLGDKKGALVDYDIAIRINPQSANTYFNRGIAKADLGDKKGALVDYQSAAQIYKAQNNMDLYERVMKRIQQSEDFNFAMITNADHLLY